jgi:putative ABC transport system ATP-binding protein
MGESVMQTPLLEAREIVKSYRGEAAQAPALRGASLSVAEGEFVCIVGRSGSGKSTLLNVLSTLLKADSGELVYQGRDLTRATETELNRLRGSDFGMVFQMHHLLPYLTTLENVLLPFMKGLSPIPEKRRERAREVLSLVGLASKQDRLPGQLSGGEQQRVAIARALAAGPSVLFADEPTGSLDKTTGRGIMELLKRINATGVTVVMVSHDPEYAAQASRRITIDDGLVVPDAA